MSCLLTNLCVRQHDIATWKATASVRKKKLSQELREAAEATDTLSEESANYGDVTYQENFHGAIGIDLGSTRICVSILQNEQLEIIDFQVCYSSLTTYFNVIDDDGRVPRRYL